MSALRRARVKRQEKLLIACWIALRASFSVSCRWTYSVSDRDRLVILLAGISWPLLSRIGLGRLPGDIMIHRDGATFFFPLVTCVIISVVLSALFWLFNR